MRRTALMFALAGMVGALAWIHRSASITSVDYRDKCPLTWDNDAVKARH